MLCVPPETKTTFEREEFKILGEHGIEGNRADKTLLDAKSDVNRRVLLSSMSSSVDDL